MNRQTQFNMCRERLHTCNEVEQISGLQDQVNELFNITRELESGALQVGKLYADVSDPNCPEVIQLVEYGSGIRADS